MPKRGIGDGKTKAKIVREVIGGVISPAEACRKYELSEGVLARWKREFVEQAHLAFGSDGSAENPQAGEVEELQRRVGKQAVELEAGVGGPKKRVGYFATNERETVVRVLKAENPQYSTRMLCRLFVVACSRLYRKAADLASDESSHPKGEGEIAKSLELAARWPRYGYRRLTAEMRRVGFGFNGKKTRRLMNELGIKGQAPKRKVRTPLAQSPSAQLPQPGTVAGGSPAQSSLGQRCDLHRPRAC